MIRLGPLFVGAGAPPLVIAEMSGNHDQSLDKALAIVDAAAAAGAHALKLQTYTAETITLDVRDGDFVISEPESLWRGEALHDLYRRAYTPWEWHPVLLERARSHGLMAFSTPFDATAVDFLESLDVPCYKIASFENGDLPLIRKVAATGKPLIMSTGTATLAELAEGVDAARSAGCRELVLLKCTSAYPADPRDANLRTIPHLRELFDCEVGLSDHTPGTAVAVAAVALGARVVEKHFCLNRSEGGVDAAFSLEPSELASLVQDTHLAWSSLGGVSYGPSEAERPSRRYRRSLYFVRDLAVGEVVTLDSVASVRPAMGLPPRFLDDILGRPVRRAVRRGTPVSWDVV